MVKIEFEADTELERLMQENAELYDKIMHIIAEEAIVEIAANFDRGGADSPWKPPIAGGKPLEGIGKLRKACTEDAVIEITSEGIEITPGGAFPPEIADHLHEDRPFMVIPNFRQDEFTNRVTERVTALLEEGK